MGVWRHAARCIAPLRPRLVRPVRDPARWVEGEGRNLPALRHLAAEPRGARGFLGLSWPRERDDLQHANRGLEATVAQLEEQQASQLAKLGDLQKSLQRLRAELSVAKGREKELDGSRKLSEIQKMEAINAADENYERAQKELERMQGVLAEVVRLAGAPPDVADEAPPRLVLNQEKAPEPPLGSRALRATANEEAGITDRAAAVVPAPTPPAPPAYTGPVVITDRQFANFDELWSYCAQLLKDTPANTRLDAADEKLMMELLAQGHPEFSGSGEEQVARRASFEEVHVRIEGDADQETGGGKVFTVFAKFGLHFTHKDGKDGPYGINFSFRRCIRGLKGKAQLGQLPEGMLP